MKPWYIKEIEERFNNRFDILNWNQLEPPYISAIDKITNKSIYLEIDTHSTWSGPSGSIEQISDEFQRIIVDERDSKIETILTSLCP